MCRFAILDGPTMPIIGEGDEEPNERCNQHTFGPIFMHSIYHSWACYTYPVFRLTMFFLKLIK